MKLGTEHVKKMCFLIPGCMDVGAVKAAFFCPYFPHLCPILAKFGVGGLQLMLLSTFEFHENWCS